MKLFIFKHYLNNSAKMKEARPTTNITAAQWREVRKVFDPNSQYDQVSFLKVLLRTTYEVGEIANGDDARCRVVITAMLVVLVIMIMMMAVVISLRYWRRQVTY